MKVIIGDILGGTVQVNPHITVYHIPILLFFCCTCMYVSGI